MKSFTLKQINLIGLILLAAAMFILVLALAWSVDHQTASVGWHELASVGWVTASS